MEEALSKILYNLDQGNINVPTAKYDILKLINDTDSKKVVLEQTKTANECWIEAGNNPDAYSRSVREAMDEYADGITEFTHNLFNNPCSELKPLENLWREENPSEHYTIPDRTSFYQWIRIKVLGV